MLDGARVLPSVQWGALLGVIIPGSLSNVLNSSDPFKVLKDKGVSTSDIFVVGEEHIDIQASRDGWLTFMVNDAVVSQHASAKISHEMHEALHNAAQELRERLHQLDTSTLPLFWFSDNIGSFRVVIRKGKCAER